MIFGSAKRNGSAVWLPATLLTLLAGCGGSQPPPLPVIVPPPPNLTALTTSLPDGVVSLPFNATLEAAGGTGARTWSISGGSLPAGLNLNSSTGEISGTPSVAVISSFTVQVQDSGSPPQTATKNLSIRISDPLTTSTASLPPGNVGKPYSASLEAAGGLPPFTWRVTAGTIPNRLTLDTGRGEITGTPDTEESQNFVVQVSDSAIPQQSDFRVLSIAIRPPPAPNDSVATATPISNGTFRASISPYADPVDTANPDTDFYEVSAQAGATVAVEILAQRLPPPSPLDPVIEILDAGGTRFNTCRNEGTTDGLVPDDPPGNSVDPTPTAFDDPCVNDDIDPGVALDSKLEFQVPGTAGRQALFVRVLDSRGDARPDFLYDLVLSGASAPNQPPVGGMDEAVDQADGDTIVPVGGTLLVRGWAADPDSDPGSPVARVEVQIDGTSVGDATLGLSRPDIAAFWGRPDFALGGWELAVGLASLPEGTHTVTVTAFDAEGSSAPVDSPRDFIVGTPPGGGPLEFNLAPAVPFATVGFLFGHSFCAPAVDNPETLCIGPSNPSGGTPPYTFQLAPGNRVPAGLTLHSNGYLSGTPLLEETVNMTLCVSDQDGAMVCRDTSIFVYPNQF
ncbi:MAG: putative Ig domain-containing protein [Terriglobia bacterium]